MTVFTPIFWMHWLNTKRVWSAVLMVGLIGVGACQRNLVAVAPVGTTMDAAAEDGERADGRPRWRTVRTLAVGDMWAASPDGRYVATIDDQRVRVTTALDGPVLHHAALPFVAHDLAVTKSAVVCYKRLDPASTSIAILNIKTGKWSQIDAQSSIWQIVADASGDGIWMSCGDHTVRHYPKISDGAAGMTQLVVPGYGGNLSADPFGCVVTEAMPSGITAISNNTTMRWHIDEENPKRVSRVITTQSGALYLDSTERSEPNNHMITRISGTTGAPLWEVQHVGKFVNVATDQKSGMLSVSVGNPDARVPAKLFVYSSDGSVIMDGRGSGYFSPMLVGVTESGHRITVIDGQRGLTTLSDSGSTLARRMPLPSIDSGLLRTQFSRLSTDDRLLFIQMTANKVLILEALHE